MARTVIDQNTIKTINERYLVLKTYAAVAREIGISPSTVKKYIIKDYQPAAEVKIKKFVVDTEQALKIQEPFILKSDMSDILILTDEEKEELKDFWKELIL